MTLKGVKVGDPIAYNYLGPSQVRLTKVAKVTPSGRVRCEDGTYWDERGRRLGPGRVRLTSDARPATDKDRADIKEQEDRGELEANVVDHLDRYDTRNALPIETVRALNAVFAKGKK